MKSARDIEGPWEDPDFDYKADLNYDGSVNLLDLIIVSFNRGESYTSGSDPP